MNLVNVSNVTNGAQIERLFFFLSFFFLGRIEILKKKKCVTILSSNQYELLFIYGKNIILESLSI